MKTPISERAVFKRLDRHFDKQGERLRKSRAGTRAEQDLGEYFVISVHSNSVVAANIDLEATARDEGVLKEYEEVVL